MEPTPSRSADPTPDTPETTTPPVAPETSTPTEAPVQTSATEPTPQVVPVVDPAASQVTPTTVNPGHGLGIASLVLSIVGVHLVGLILGIIALNKSKKAGHKNGLALAGIIIGAVGMVIGAILLVVLISVAGQLAGVCADLGSGVHDVNGVTYTCS